jgi:hypothetical protein
MERPGLRYWNRTIDPTGDVPSGRVVRGDEYMVHQLPRTWANHSRGLCGSECVNS